MVTNRAFFNSVAERWDSIAIHDAHRVKKILSCAGIAQGDRVLDVGTGTGVLAMGLSEAVGPKGDVVAIDIAEKMLAIAESKFAANNLSFVHGDYLAFDSPQPFDAIIAYSCFPHFPDRPAFHRKARSLLKVPGGRLLIAHSEGREAINSMHADIDEGPVSLPLPPVGILVSELSEAGFAAKLCCDDENFYYVLATLV